MQPELSITKMCRVLGMTKQAFYGKESYVSRNNENTEMILEKVKYIREKLPMTGGRKLYYMLSLRNVNVGRDRLYKILRKHKLLVRSRRKYARTTNSNHWFKKHKDIFKNCMVEKPEQVFVSDITYIRVKDGFNYLSLVTDAYSRRIMGSRLSMDLSKEGTIAALQEAISNRMYNHPLMHHSDRGLQYCSNDYIKTLEACSVSISMTESGSPYDNAIAERVNGILKTELGLDKVFEEHDQASKAVETAVKRYNKLRPHMSCGYLTPNQAHKSKKPVKRLWKKKTYKHYNKAKEKEYGGDKSYSDQEPAPSGEAKAPMVGNNFYETHNIITEF